MSDDCIFCKIASGAIPAKFVYEDEFLVAFPDINPMAPVHVLVIPRKHLDSVAAAGPSDSALLGHALLTLLKIAAKLELPNPDSEWS